MYLPRSVETFMHTLFDEKCLFVLQWLSYSREGFKHDFDNKKYLQDLTSSSKSIYVRGHVTYTDFLVVHVSSSCIQSSVRTLILPLC